MQGTLDEIDPLNDAHKGISMKKLPDISKTLYKSEQKHSIQFNKQPLLLVGDSGGRSSNSLLGDPGGRLSKDWAHDSKEISFVAASLLTS